MPHCAEVRGSLSKLSFFRPENSTKNGAFSGAIFRLFLFEVNGRFQFSSPPNLQESEKRNVLDNDYINEIQQLSAIFKMMDTRY